jgi:EAL domain-containing protein (putative c-di-GMP-specific phosphodiesterase class I)
MNAFSTIEVGILSQQGEIDPEVLAPDELLDVVLSRRFGVEYQPVIDVQAGDVAGYQASARFWTRARQSINAGRMFAALHRNPLLLYYAELEIKKLQITHAPALGWLMLDLDIDSFFEGGNDVDNAFLQLFRQYSWSEREIIVNIVENHNIADAQRSQRMIALLQQGGTAVALEDIGVRWGMFSLSAFLDAAVVKFNGLALQALNEKAAQATVDWLVSAARRIGVQTLMAGVDSCVQFEWAKRMGVDCVQGRLFERQVMRVC